MSTTIVEDVITALNTPTVILTYPQAAPQNTAKPFVIYRVQESPINTIHGYSGLSSFEFTFECWAETALGALNLAASLRTRIDAASSLIKERIAAAENDYAPDTDEFVELVAYRFWKTT